MGDYSNGGDWVVTMGSFEIRRIYVARMPMDQRQSTWEHKDGAVDARRRWIGQLEKLVPEGKRKPEWDIQVIQVADGENLSPPAAGYNLHCRVIGGKAYHVLTDAARHGERSEGA